MLIKCASVNFVFQKIFVVDCLCVGERGNAEAEVIPCSLHQLPHLEKNKFQKLEVEKMPVKGMIVRCVTVLLCYC